MTDYIRRLVSGNKARFKDGDLNLELDLVYVTDQIVIMGYPAAGVEGLYRNRREDAVKFLNHRHGKNYWVFNFCPIKENSYPSTVFDGRVSRYPFPDHHAPPLAIMPLIAREMNLWLSSSPNRVAVLHCKAGKGRSGTMACTYLLTLQDDPSPPQLERSYAAKEWAKIRADDLMAVIPADEAEAALQADPSATDEVKIQRTDTPASMTSAEHEAAPPKVSKDSLSNILDLHTSRRMKTPSSPDKQVKQDHLWPSTTPRPPSPKVRLTEIKVRLRESSSLKMNLVRAANKVMDYTSSSKAPKNGKGTGSRGGQIWVSLARYDDEFVEFLEKWELHTRDAESGRMGHRKKGAEHMGTEAVSEMFADGKWDSGKMVRSFARMGAAGDTSVQEGTDKITTHTLRPLSDVNWTSIRNDLQVPDAEKVELESANIPASENNSMYDVTQSLKSEKGIVVDATREVRFKLYMGKVFMGWFWFVPTFHMPRRQTAAFHRLRNLSSSRLPGKKLTSL
ncbi:hypothetical protein HGRIS_000513 [Hohenbuehelia grisea]|uniref:phosphatidylinositol-3,4,5-trisphosphate 3-phosphatase n=1 Tax=Hohenbuehelia grisea TaxID=104357 RepID=A0ABR3JS71_9AGAR